MSNLILIRHGQSVWNLQNRFTGWYDVALSDNGLLEANKAGVLLKKLHIKIEFAYTSYLRRAIQTLEIILNVIKDQYIDPVKAWELNERHYGNLTGLIKNEMKKKLGEEQVKILRRSWDIAPPELGLEDEFNPRLDEVYKSLNPKDIPNTESLKDTYDRVIPYFEKNIKPKIFDNKNVLVVAHGNSLRALCKKLFDISDKKISELEIPTGNPLFINIDSEFNILDSYYLDESRGQKLLINE
ncbi:MAG: 2,3-bisphosphoglycerate-dependent phosphoglycerate mutase [Alphaproteobacteria bacterium MarineAlpha9_Bin2]|nr:MAG: 2,3-bisphosphoglycerate-dependent phosphoglycerate mutase [Alphaproteobacteria bacterium MarineAlpha9_Bin1]PPR30289.1 MAG: 2,3-bisphosphoglycerate-dependent phosphoglycerate mutase [Alphaproteobacteria bacterium MarineAlpha9_Bin2]